MEYLLHLFDHDPSLWYITSNYVVNSYLFMSETLGYNDVYGHTVCDITT